MRQLVPGCTAAIVPVAGSKVEFTAPTLPTLVSEVTDTAGVTFYAVAPEIAARSAADNILPPLRSSRTIFTKSSQAGADSARAAFNCRWASRRDRKCRGSLSLKACSTADGDSLSGAGNYAFSLRMVASTLQTNAMASSPLFISRA